MLLDRLKADPEAPWADYGRTGLTAMKLGDAAARVRHPIGQHPLRPPYGQAKGYQRTDFIDAWARYCPGPQPATDGDPSQPSHSSLPSSTPGRVIPLGRVDPSQKITTTDGAGTG